MVFDRTGFARDKVYHTLCVLHSFIYGPIHPFSWNSILSGVQAKKTNILLILKRKWTQPHIKYTNYLICLKSYTLNTEIQTCRSSTNPRARLSTWPRKIHTFFLTVSIHCIRRCLFTSCWVLRVVPCFVDTNQSPTVSCRVGKPTLLV